MIEIRKNQEGFHWGEYAIYSSRGLEWTGEHEAIAWGVADRLSRELEEEIEIKHD